MSCCKHANDGAPKLRVRFAADGRYGFPEIVEYQTRSGDRHVVPPLDGKPYRLIIHDLAAYDRMFRTGQLGLGHAYLRVSEIIDNRTAPGG